MMLSGAKDDRDGDGGPMRRTTLRLRVWNVYEIWKYASEIGRAPTHVTFLIACAIRLQSQKF